MAKQQRRRCIKDKQPPTYNNYNYDHDHDHTTDDYNHNGADHNQIHDNIDAAASCGVLEDGSNSSQCNAVRGSATHRHTIGYTMNMREKAHRRQLNYHHHNMVQASHTTSQCSSLQSCHRTITTYYTTTHNSITPQPQFGRTGKWLKTPDGVNSSSTVTCPTALHPQSSQCGCISCVDSSGLSAALVSTTCERVNPHEWGLHGDDGREVMSLAQGSPRIPGSETDNSSETFVPNCRGHKSLQRARARPEQPGAKS